MINRRDALKTLGATMLAAAAPAPLLALDARAKKSARTDRPNLDAAIRAARWIRKSRLTTEHGVVWPADPNDEKSVGTTLYSGSPGVILFLLELHAATGDASYLADASAAADHLVATMPSGDKRAEHGLYEGIAGHAFALDLAWRQTGRGAYRDAATRCIDIIKREAIEKDGGVQWNDTTDIISGAAGTGLALLWWAGRANDPAARALAAKSGRRLLDLSTPAPGGLMWRVDPVFARVMPNFSHGTAGIAYFLASLHQHTGDRALLDAAMAGATHLQTIAKKDDDTCTIYHHDGDGQQLFYLGWCHGPVGTARLFQRLSQITKSSNWRAWVRRSARGISTSGVPEQRTPGFWNNASQCCGNAGVAEFFLDLHRSLGDSVYLDYTRRVNGDLLRRATPDGDGIKWVQAEHRVKPELLIAQTGYMQGAAGMGTWLLHMDGFENRRKPLVVLPDNPWSDG
ncbi:MAG: lanthionine synthetase LanC family protein [Gemmatimonadaceae bacterium]